MAKAPILYGTDFVARQIGVPDRTVRRWCQRQQIGQIVLGRRLLTRQDVERIKTLHRQSCMVLT